MSHLISVELDSKCAEDIMGEIEKFVKEHQFNTPKQIIELGNAIREALDTDDAEGC